MSKEYINFELEKNNEAYLCKNLSGKSPYIYKKILYIPLEMIDKEWLKKKGYFTTKIKDENNNTKKINNENKTSLKEEEKIKQFREPTGLVNINGICYMNAVLQCFYYCRPLTNYFMNLYILLIYNHYNLKYFLYKMNLDLLVLF